MEKVVSLLRFGMIAVFSAAVISPAKSQVPQQLPPKSETRPGPAQAQFFEHPDIGYSVAIPPGAEVRERQGENGQISIRSRKGYSISVQTGSSHHDVPINQLSRFIEAKFLGQDKPWRERLKDREINVAGLPAYEIRYDGPNTLSQVVFVRGRKIDYVIIYIAGHLEFRKYVNEFDWFLKNFSPAKDDLAGSSDKFETKANKFSKPSFGYSMLFPADWEQSSQQGMTMMFSGRQGTPAYTSIVSVQNVNPPSVEGSGDALARAITDLKNNFNQSVPTIEFTIDQPWVYNRGGVQLHGRELNASYKHAGETFRKVIFVIPRPNQPVVHIWSYTAPEKDFQTYQPLVEQMLRSWTIINTSHG